MLANKSYSERVAGGKAKEEIIIDTLRGNGLNIEKPTTGEDMYDKIDGWLVENGVRKSIQIKFREGGNDVLFEIVKDVYAKIDGRDLISKSDYYLVVDTMGIGRLFDTKPFKDAAKKIKEVLMPTIHSGKTSWSFPMVDIKLTTDQSHGNLKLMAFFNPNKFTAIKSWKFDLNR